MNNIVYRCILLVMLESINDAQSHERNTYFKGRVQDPADTHQIVVYIAHTQTLISGSY